MTIDLHALLEKNHVTKSMLKPKFGYRYLGPFNDMKINYITIKILEIYILIMINLKTY